MNNRMTFYKTSGHFCLKRNDIGPTICSFALRVIRLQTFSHFHESCDIIGGGKCVAKPVPSLLTLIHNSCQDTNV